eukprot:9396209-Alexandrium_andersonii.AAC.1
MLSLAIGLLPLAVRGVRRLLLTAGRLPHDRLPVRSRRLPHVAPGLLHDCRHAGDAWREGCRRASEWA